MNIQEAQNYFYHLHDVECNQKYNKTLPYSFHLEMIKLQYNKFEHLIPLEKARPLNQFNTETTRDWVLIGCFGHDSIEDARLTYNDIKEKFGDGVAEIIYLCTENKDKNRKERKSDEFYKELITNKLAVFVKLCDLIANVKFSFLTNSTMFDKYKQEFNDKKHYFSDFPQIIEYLDKIFSI